MDIFITGASGKLGRYLLPLLNPEHHYCILARQPVTFDYELNSTKYLICDLKEIKDKKDEITDYDVFLWLASKVSYESTYKELYEVNVKPLEDLLEIKRDIRIIYVSSISVYGFHSENITEETELKPETEYGKSKKAAEDVVKQFRSYTILRPAIMIGRNYSEGFKEVYNLLKKNFYFYMGSKHSRIPFVHPKDVARAIVYSLENPSLTVNQHYNVSQAAPTQEEIISLVCREKNLHLPRYTLPAWLVKLLFGKKKRHLIDQLSKTRIVSSEKLIKTGFIFEKTWEEGAKEILSQFD